jgi:hypothetical protein
VARTWADPEAPAGRGGALPPTHPTPTPIPRLQPGLEKNTHSTVLSLPRPSCAGDWGRSVGARRVKKPYLPRRMLCGKFSSLNSCVSVKSDPRAIGQKESPPFLVSKSQVGWGRRDLLAKEDPGSREQSVIIKG